jgi:hypothetical protein
VAATARGTIKIATVSSGNGRDIHLIITLSKQGNPMLLVAGWKLCADNARIPVEDSIGL